MATTLGDFVQITSGHPFRGRIESNKDGDVYVVQMRNIDAEGRIDVKSLTLAKSVRENSLDRLRQNDIVFIAKGSNNTASLVEGLTKDTVCAPHFFHLRIKPNKQNSILAGFICWQLNQKPAQRYFKVSAEGSLQVSIRKKVLEDTPFVLPDLETQRNIVNLHRCAMREIKTYHQLIENRQLEMTAIASDLLNRLDKST
ncbi:restriction endonuclease subunit S [Marinomonas sp. IMCC 4694]|uniref:restriction endonuclease subunit S n=1 Tax=Marinomonas sp. IMCC 4694 TaxID=2605432 RepID=UPI0011E82AB9|nr:restriction endonuclease subunit S [Marinomonas sp. IMCC 4694]TYL46897.1 restriction endonuclease subunit S [Marinomonas sp. IMCC 4694]